MITRREFGTLALAGVMVRLKPDPAVEVPLVRSTDTGAVNGVRLGVQTYSFRDLPRPAGAVDSVDVVIKAMQRAGVSECELFAPQLEPQFRRAPAASAARGPRPRRSRRARICASGGSRRRSITSENAKKKFDAAGIAISAYYYNMNDSFTDAEIDRGFEMTKALGANDHDDLDAR